jgi:hypothetical protein
VVIILVWAFLVVAVWSSSGKSQGETLLGELIRFG